MAKMKSEMATLGVVPNPLYNGIPHIMTTTQSREEMERMVTVGDIPNFPFIKVRPIS